MEQHGEVQQALRLFSVLNSVWSRIQQEVGYLQGGWIVSASARKSGRQYCLVCKHSHTAATRHFFMVGDEGNPVSPKEMERGVVTNSVRDVSRQSGACMSMNIINLDTRLGFLFVNSVTVCPSKCRQHGRDDCRVPLKCCFRCRHNRLHLHIVNEYPALTVHAKVFGRYRTAALSAGVVCSSEKCLEVEAQFSLKLFV